MGNSLTLKDDRKIERVQKIALRIILKESYLNYENALSVTGLPTLRDRRKDLCLRFATKCTKFEKTSQMFPLNKNGHIKTRHSEIYDVPFAFTNRLKFSSIPSMARLLNEESTS